jgi:2-dehydropantoate 2-reductase
MARYIIIGAGAVGGTIGARLFESGHDVVLVARGEHLGVLRGWGLKFLTPESESILAVPAVGGPEELTPGADDVLILATKTQHSEAALEPWTGYAHARAGQPPIILAQNGVANEPLALRRYPRVYGASVWLPAVHLEPGVVEAQKVPVTGILHLGRYPEGADDFIRGVAGDLESSKFRAPVSDAVMRWKYAKLLGNLASAVEALTGNIEAKEAQELVGRARAEGVAVLEAAGIGYASKEEQAPYWELLQGKQANKGLGRPGGSSWQSLARQSGSVESDYINGEIVLLGRVHGVPTPVNEAVQLQVKISALNRRPPGSLSIAELNERVEAGVRSSQQS